MISAGTRVNYEVSTNNKVQVKYEFTCICKNESKYVKPVEFGDEEVQLLESGTI